MSILRVPETVCSHCDKTDRETIGSIDCATQASVDPATHAITVASAASPNEVSGAMKAQGVSSR